MYSREEILVEIQRIKNNITKGKGYGKNYGRLKTLTQFEKYLELPLTYDILLKDLGITVNPIGKTGGRQRKKPKSKTVKIKEPKNSKTEKIKVKGPKMEMQILSHLNVKATEPSKENAKIVKEFVDGLTELLQCEEGILSNSSLMHCGSSYEGLVVKAKSDFDLPLILSDPFVGKNFKIFRDPKTLLFLLQWMGDLPRKYDKYCDGKFLNAKELQKETFERLTVMSNQISIPGWSIKVEDGLAALAVTLQRGQEKIDIDLAPQIPVRQWDGCPDIQPLSSLPAKLADHIRALEENSSPIYFFSPAVPNSAIRAAQTVGQSTSFSAGYEDHSTSYGHQLLNTSFSILEKNFLQMDTDVRDMVRLMKLVVDRKDWKNYGIRSFHVKRVAISRYQELKLEPTIWAGFKKLVEFLRDDLINEKGIGCFVKNQLADTIRDTDDFIKELKSVNQMTREQLYNLI